MLVMLLLSACGPDPVADAATGISFSGDWDIAAAGQGTEDSSHMAEPDSDDVGKDRAVFYGAMYASGDGYIGEGGVELVQGGVERCIWRFPIDATETDPCPGCSLAVVFAIDDIVVEADADCSALPPSALDGQTFVVGFDDENAYYIDESGAWEFLGYPFSKPSYFGWFTPLQ